MTDLNLDDFSKVSSGFVEDNERKRVCGQYIDHLVDKDLIALCFKCGASQRSGIGVVANMWTRQVCDHKWKDMKDCCAMCWAEPRSGG